jgi:Uma2 family endonuclease
MVDRAAAVAPAPRFLTLEEYAALPDRDDGTIWELVDGIPVLVNRPRKGHAELSKRLEGLLGGRLGPAWVVRAEAGVQLKPRRTVYGPDVASWPAAAYDAIADDDWPGAPVLVIEIRSPGDTPSRFLPKVGRYLEAGTEEVWWVDPRRQRVLRYRPADEPAEVVLPGGTLALPGTAQRVTVEELLSGRSGR